MNSTNYLHGLQEDIITSLFPWWHKISDTGNIKERKLILTPSFRSFSLWSANIKEKTSWPKGTPEKSC